MRYLVILSCVFSVLMLSGCKTGKTLTGAKAERTVKNVIQEANLRDLKFETLSIQGKADIKIPAQGFDMSVNYRASVLKDSVIVVRFTKFGLEAIRIQVRKDSITVVNKTNSTYQVAGYGLAEQFTGIRPDFGMIQDVLLGNLYVAPDTALPRRLPSKDWELTGDKKGTSFEYLIDSESLKPLSIRTKNVVRNQASEVTYSEFKPTGNTVVPQVVGIKLTAPWEFSTTMSHTKLEVNPSNPTFSFEIPAGYQRTPVK